MHTILSCPFWAAFQFLETLAKSSSVFASPNHVRHVSSPPKHRNMAKENDKKPNSKFRRHFLYIGRSSLFCGLIGTNEKPAFFENIGKGGGKKPDGLLSKKYARAKRALTITVYQNPVLMSNWHSLTKNKLFNPSQPLPFPKKAVLIVLLGKRFCLTFLKECGFLCV